MLQATREVRGTPAPGLIYIFCSGYRLFPLRRRGWGRMSSLPHRQHSTGVVLLLCAVSYFILQNSIIAIEGPASRLAAAVGRDRKGKISLSLYVVAIALAFIEPLYLTLATYSSRESGLYRIEELSVRFARVEQVYILFLRKVGPGFAIFPCAG